MTAPVTREVVRIPFRDGEVLTVEIGGRPHVVLRPALETIGLDYSAQWRKIQGRSWATVVHATTVAADGSIREMATVDVRTFLMLLATINESHVSDAVRPTLVAYQNEVADAIEAYWTRGVAVNPRSNVVAPRLLSLEEAAAVLRQEYRLDYTVVDLTRAMRAAGITRLSGGPKKDAFGLLWFNGSAWMVVAEFIGELAKLLGRTEEKVGAQLERGFQMQLDLTPARGLAEIST